MIREYTIHAFRNYRKIIYAMQFHRMNGDTTQLQARTKQLLLLARIREKSGHLNSSLATLKEARDNQYRLQKRLAVDQSGGLQEQHIILSKYIQCPIFSMAIGHLVVTD